MESLYSILKTACDEAEIELNERYSGRGMHGRDCVGIASSRQSVMTIIADVLQQITQNVFDSTIDAESEEELRAAHAANSTAADYISQLMDYEQDSFGFDVIIYWSKIRAPEELSDDWIAAQDQRTLLMWVAEQNKAYVSPEDDLASLSGLRQSVRMIRDRIESDMPV